MGPHAILSKLKWDDRYNLLDAEIHYIHRGAPDDTMIIMGSQITTIESGYFTMGDACIPYHRIKLVLHQGEVMYTKRGHESEVDIPADAGIESGSESVQESGSESGPRSASGDEPINGEQFQS